MKTPAPTRTLRSIGLPLALAAMVAASSGWQWLARVDGVVYDHALRHGWREAPRDILIVAIDDESLQAIGPWPWRRAIHAEAVKQAHAGGARSVLLNLLLTEPDPAQDVALASALPGAHVVLPVAPPAPGNDGEGALLPVAALRTAVQLGHADAAADADGVVRRAALWAGQAGTWWPHPAMALLQAAGQPQPQGEPAPAYPPGATWQRASNWLIPYLPRDQRIPQVSYADLLRAQVPKGLLLDRDVLIGVTARGLGAGVRTPIDREGELTPGIEVIAQVLHGLRQGWQVRTLPQAAQAALSAGAILLLWAVLRRCTPRQALLACIGLALLALAGAWGLMQAGVWWPPVTLALGALLCQPLWSWQRMERTAQALEAELQAIRSDGGTTAAPDSLPGDYLQRRTTAIRQAGAALRHDHQTLSRTLSALPDAVFVLDRSGRITQLNQQALGLIGLTGQPESTARGLLLDTALNGWTPQDAPTWQMLVERACESRQMQRSEATHPNGGHRLVSLMTAGPQADADVLVCAADVTALREAELQRAELLGFIAHDLRSPPASLISLVELRRLGGGGLSEQEVLSHVETMARQTLSLCEELLQVMRAENRPLSTTPGDVSRLADEVIRDMQPQAIARQQRLLREAGDPPAVLAVFDDYLLHRALGNLISNAIKFGPPGSEVLVSARHDAGGVLLTVQDQGPGIPESELGRLFRRYERVEQGRPSKLAAGIGLGLVFIDTVARRHGGRVRVHNQAGSGARFELWLPQASAHAADRPDTPLTGQVADPPQQRTSTTGPNQHPEQAA